MNRRRVERFLSDVHQHHQTMEKRHLMAVRSGDVTPSAVPIPAALPLLLSGLAALWVAGRRRERLGELGASAS